MRAYKVQLLHKIEPNDKLRRNKFAFEMLMRIAEDGNFLERICFTDEATFHVSGKITKQNIRIWGSENPHVTRELERDSPKVNVWCGILRNQVIGPFFFAEKTITANTYLDLLIGYVAPQLEERQP